jgi:copper homeostasis protein
MRPILLEVCLTSVDDAISAHQAGADRIELNAALSLDGLTPTPGMLQAVRRAIPLPIVTMIRTRPGHFVLSESDFTVMIADAEWALAAGSAGLAFGILTRDRKIDMKRCRTFREKIGRREAVFHRAFDQVDDPLIALEQLIDLGVTRIMTSGGSESAIDGAAQIRQLIEHANERIEILPAGGINPGNVLELVKQTGCRQVHGSFRRLGTADDSTDGAAVAETRKLLSSLL